MERKVVSGHVRRVSQRAGTTDGVNSICHGFRGGVQLTVGGMLANPELVAIYWGDFYVGNVSVTGALDQFFAEMLRSWFFLGLFQYGVNSGTLVSSHIIPGSWSNDQLSQADAKGQLTSWMDAGVIEPVTQDSAAADNRLYLLLPPPGLIVSDNGDTSSTAICGYHLYHTYTGDLLEFPFAVVATSEAVDAERFVSEITPCLTHEIVEACADPSAANGSTRTGVKSATYASIRRQPRWEGGRFSYTGRTRTTRASAATG